MPLRVKVPLPGPFSYSTSIGGRRRRPAGPSGSGQRAPSVGATIFGFFAGLIIWTVVSIRVLITDPSPGAWLGFLICLLVWAFVVWALVQFFRETGRRQSPPPVPQPIPPLPLPVAPPPAPPPPWISAADPQTQLRMWQIYREQYHGWHVRAYGCPPPPLPPNPP